MDLLIKLVAIGLVMFIALSLVFALYDLYDGVVKGRSLSGSVGNVLETFVGLGDGGDAELLRGDGNRASFMARFYDYVNRIVERYSND